MRKIVGYRVLVHKRNVVMTKPWISQSIGSVGKYRRHDEGSQHTTYQPKKKFTENSETVEEFCCVIPLMGLNMYLMGDGDDSDDRILRSEVMYNK
jgi:hypothetical protein